MKEMNDAGDQHKDLWLESFYRDSEKIERHDTQLLYKAVFPILFP